MNRESSVWQRGIKVRLEQTFVHSLVRRCAPSTMRFWKELKEWSSQCINRTAANNFSNHCLSVFSWYQQKNRPSFYRRKVRIRQTQTLLSAAPSWARIKPLTFTVPSSLRLMRSKSKSFLSPSVLLRTMRPVRPSHWAWVVQRRVEETQTESLRFTSDSCVHGLEEEEELQQDQNKQFLSLVNLNWTTALSGQLLSTIENKVTELIRDSILCTGEARWSQIY